MKNNKRINLETIIMITFDIHDIDAFIIDSRNADYKREYYVCGECLRSSCKILGESGKLRKIKRTEKLDFDKVLLKRGLADSIKHFMGCRFELFGNIIHDDRKIKMIKSFQNIREFRAIIGESPIFSYSDYKGFYTRANCLFSRLIEDSLSISNITENDECWFLYVHENKWKICGFCRVEVRRDTVIVRLLSILPKYQNRGLGTSFLTRILSNYKDNYIREFSVERPNKAFKNLAKAVELNLGIKIIPTRMEMRRVN